MEKKNTAPGEKKSVNKPSGVRKTAAYYLTGPIVRVLARMRISPNMVSWTGFILTCGAAALIFTGYLFAAGFAVILAGFFDMLDGALARLTDRITKFGGILDSTLDRLSEAVLLLGVLYVYAAGNSVWGAVLVGIVLVGSLMVSYIRSRAEASGLKCEVGILTRPERVIVLALGLLLSRIDYALTVSLAVIAVFSFITVIQRMTTVRRQTEGSEKSG